MLPYSSLSENGVPVAMCIDRTFMIKVSLNKCSDRICIDSDFDVEIPYIVIVPVIEIPRQLAVRSIILLG